MDKEFLETVTLLQGGHNGSRSKFCFREALAMVIEGQPHDDEIACLTRAQALGIPLNDSCAWRDKEHRTSVMRPALRRMALCHRNPAKDREIATRLVDYAVHEFALTCGEPRIEQWAEGWLDGSDRSAETAEAAYMTARGWNRACRYVTESTLAEAAGLLSEVSEMVAVAAAETAEWAVAKAAEADAEAIERYTRALFEIVFDVYGV